MKKQRIVKVTRHLPADDLMGLNQFNAQTYGEWCEYEAMRIGKEAYVQYESRKNGEWCHIERLSSLKGG